MASASPDGAEAANILTRLAERLPGASPLAQAFLLILLEREEARLATLARTLDLPLALAVRAATELTGLSDETGAALADFTEGHSPGAGTVRLTEAGLRLAQQAVAPTGAQTGRMDH